MTESQLYELLAKKQAAIENAANFEAGTLNLLRQLKAGTIDISRVEVGDNGWQLKPEDEKPAGRLATGSANGEGMKVIEHK